MGYRKVPIIYTLELDGDYKGLVVRLKSMKIGEMRKIVRLLDSDEDNTITVLDEMVKAIAKGIVSWNLEDEQGVPVEPTVEALDDLEFELIQKILDEWLSRVTGPSPELGKDSSSGEKFPGQPLLMEAL
jgi:hypothetical protein